MSFFVSVKLYLGSAQQGQITFHSLIVKETSDYTCKPEGILNHDEAKELFRQMRQDPLALKGVIGKYVWRV